MGAGKGKAKRALAPASKLSARTVAYEVLFKPDVWSEFIRNSGIESIRLHKYYLGHMSGTVSCAEYEQIIVGLLADAVSVGAIVLPVPYQPEDFTFMVNKVDAYRSDAEVLVMNEPLAEGTLCNVDTLLGPSGLYIRDVDTAVEQLAESITYAL